MKKKASFNKRFRSEHSLFPSSPTRSIKNQELVENANLIDEELNELHAHLSQFNYKLLIASRLVWPANKYLEKIIDKLSSIFSKTSETLQHLHAVQSHLLYKDIYVVRFANILSRFKKRINESGMFPRIITIDNVQDEISTLENRPDWLVIFYWSIRNALDKMAVTEKVKNQFTNLIETITVLETLTNQYMRKRTEVSSVRFINKNENPNGLFVGSVVKEKERAEKIQKTTTASSVFLAK